MIWAEGVLRLFNEIYSWYSFSLVLIVYEIGYSSGSEGDCLDSYLLFYGIGDRSLYVFYFNSVLLFRRLCLRDLYREAYTYDFELGGVEFLPFLDYFGLIFLKICFWSEELNLVAKNPPGIYISLFRVYLYRRSLFEGRGYFSCLFLH